MWSRKLALFGLGSVLGCGPDGVEVTCLIAQPIEPGICRVLPTGLVLREQGEMITAGMLLDDGTIEPAGPLPEAIDCFTEIGGTEDWQRELTNEVAWVLRRKPLTGN